MTRASIPHPSGPCALHIDAAAIVDRAEVRRDRYVTFAVPPLPAFRRRARRRGAGGVSRGGWHRAVAAMAEAALTTTPLESSNAIDTLSPSRPPTLISSRT